MPTTDAATERHATNSFDRATLLVALELSRSRWLVTSLSPGSGVRSNHTVAGGDGSALLDLLTHLQSRATRRVGMPVDIVVIQEAGLDGFWIHRLLVTNGIESHVVEPASIAVWTILAVSFCRRPGSDCP